MKFTTQAAARNAVKNAHEFQRNLQDGGRLVIYSRHTDNEGLNWVFWICRQFKNPIFGSNEFPGACQCTVSGQLYLDKDEVWREPHGSAAVKTFSTPAAAIQFANSVPMEGEQVAA